jgi:integrase/recombinase XerD
MQNLKLATQEYQIIEIKFSEWLRLLNFEQSTVRYAPKKAQEFFYWLEQRNIREITGITKAVIYDYFDYLQNHRQNAKKGGKISKNYLRSHLTALRKLARYLRETGQESFEVGIQLKGKASNIKSIFSKEEIRILYQVCKDDLLGIRDKALLAVYYGCGLRRNEGTNLDVNDILFDRNLLYVRKGKNYKERFVPMTEAIQEDLLTYIESSRAVLLIKNTEALFISYRGNRLSGNLIAERIQMLKRAAGIEKQAGLHTLRHSIATHLLQSGMKLDQIKTFLGHSSLESTQIYTHIAYENQ